MSITNVPPQGGGQLGMVSAMPVCVCRKVKEMGPFSASIRHTGRIVYIIILFEVRGNGANTELQTK